MPWKENTTMSLKEEFVLMASQDDANIRHLSRMFNISPKTAYKWLNRFQLEGVTGLSDRSRRPLSSPARTTHQLEELVLKEREHHPAWGGRKLHARLVSLHPHLAVDIPHPNTITDILRRHNCLLGPFTPPHNTHNWHRFEHPSPNDLWQMDFKGHFPTSVGPRCHPLTLLDDHSRFSLGVRACANEQGSTVQAQLIDIFRAYGLPVRMSMDNGSPWGDTVGSPYTPLTVWLMRLGVGVSHSRPYHPQTQGKDERFHRTMKAEVLQGRLYSNLQECQSSFDQWRSEYNLHRPHEALGMQVPASRYKPSNVEYPEQQSPIEYSQIGTQGVLAIRKVQGKGEVFYKGREWHVSKAFKGYQVALKETETEGVLAVYFCQHPITRIDLHSPEPTDQKV